MRKLFIASLLLSSATINAQSVLPATGGNKFQSTTQAISQNDATKTKNWFITKYAGLNTGYSFFKGGNAFFTSMPVGIQLNRRITNNVFAFAGVQVAPTYANFNQAFLSSSFSKYGGMGAFNQNQLLLPARAEMGLMYTNDQRTFSISGSISVQKSNYALPYYQPAVFGGPVYQR